MTDQTSEQKTYESVDMEPVAIVVHCSDPRFQKAFGEYIRNELGLKEGEYIPLVISGGVASLSEPLKLPKEFKFMKERIEMFLERFDSIKRIVLINHEDCRHYDALKDVIGGLFLRHAPAMVERQQRDLLGVAKTLLGLFRPNLKLELYYARFLDGDHRQIVFEEIKR
jgi:hypothetical protein